MKTLKEITLDSAVLTPQTVYLAKGAEVLDLAVEDKILKLTILKDIDAENNQLRTFKICTKDENIYFDAVKYIGSFETMLGKRYLLEIKRGD